MLKISLGRDTMRFADGNAAVEGAVSVQLTLMEGGR
jgi:hypothetical protein